MRGYKTRTNCVLRRTDGRSIYGYKFILWIDGRAYLGNSTKPEVRARQYRTLDIPLMVKAGKWEHADDIFSTGNHQHNEASTVRATQRSGCGAW